MWDDFSPFIHGDGPTSTVLDPDLNPNNILERGKGGTVRVDWAISGPGANLLAGTQFVVSLYADPVGPNPNVMVGSANAPGAGPYTASISIAPNSLNPDAYRLTALVTHLNAVGQPTNLAGFVDGPIIQVRQEV
jgi:hypothetical protein